MGGLGALCLGGDVTGHFPSLGARGRTGGGRQPTRAAGACVRITALITVGADDTRGHEGARSVRVAMPYVVELAKSACSRAGRRRTGGEARRRRG